MSLINQTILAEVGRQLVPEDLALMHSTKVGSKTPQLKKVRAVHHAAARMLATGMKASEVSMHVGLCPSRISILQNDPAFSDLITHYKNAEGERFAVVQDRMAMLGMIAAEELQERILEGAEDLATRDLTDILRHALDRGGYAPVTKSETKTTHTLDPNAIQALKAATQENQNGRVIHRRPTKTLPADSRTVDVSISGTSGAVAETKTLAGLTLEGLDL